MFKHILALVLVSVVSGCVTSDSPYSRSATRPGRTQHVAQAAQKVAASPENRRPAI